MGVLIWVDHGKVDGRTAEERDCESVVDNFGLGIVEESCLGLHSSETWRIELFEKSVDSLGAAATGSEQEDGGEQGQKFSHNGPVLLLQSLRQSLSKLIGARGGFCSAADTLTTFDHIGDFHPFGKGGDALGVAVTSAVEADIGDNAIVNLDGDMAGAGAAGIVFDCHSV